MVTKVQWDIPLVSWLKFWLNEIDSNWILIWTDSVIGNEETLESFELHICVKDYCFARDDSLVGVAVMQLKDIVEQVRPCFFSIKLELIYARISNHRVLARVGWHWASVATWTRLAGRSCGSCHNARTTKWLASLSKWNQTCGRKNLPFSSSRKNVTFKKEQQLLFSGSSRFSSLDLLHVCTLRLPVGATQIVWVGKVRKLYGSRFSR